MSVMVDELKVWPNARHPCFKAGSAHLTADTLEELHAFAKRIGLKREWFQAHPLAPHYDLSPKRHAAALAAGATLISAREQAMRRRRATGWPVLPTDPDDERIVDGLIAKATSRMAVHPMKHRSDEPADDEKGGGR